MTQVEIQDLYGLPWGLPNPERLRLFIRRSSAEFWMVVRVPIVGTYEEQVGRIYRFVWSRLPQQWRQSSKLQLRFGFHKQNPALYFDPDENAKVLQYSKNIGSEGNPRFVTVKKELANTTYDYHESTQKHMLGHEFQWRRNNQEIQSIRSEEDLARAVAAHIADRADLKEYYEAEYLEHTLSNQDDVGAGNGYLRPDYLMFTFVKMRYDTTLPNGAKWASLLKERLTANDQCKSGDCVFQLMIDTFGQKGDARVQAPLRDTTPQIREKVGILSGWGVFGWPHTNRGALQVANSTPTTQLSSEDCGFRRARSTLQPVSPTSLASKAEPLPAPVSHGHLWSARLWVPVS